MPTHLVNLDSLIQREDFEASADGSIIGSEPLFKVEELASDKLYFSVLRKPDFQRMTANWSPVMIMEFIRSFLDGELIPSIIIWHSKTSGKVFVIDGAHRLSALIAWVNDDYGDGDISKKAWNYAVPKAQADFHKKTKGLVDQHIGTFAYLKHIGLHADTTANADNLRRGRAIATRLPHIQRVDGDAKIAEKSFFTINSNPATIDDTELSVIKARNKPNVIATRALIAAGKGHQYWAKFTEHAGEIRSLAEEVYNLLFGEIVDIGAQSPDLPRAGQPYSEEAFKMVLDIVNIFNDVTPAMWERENDEPSRRRKIITERLSDDTDGVATVKFLAKVKDVACLVTGAENRGSLGMDQAVYSYGATGKFHPAAYIAALKFAKELKAEDKFKRFTVIRADFEEFFVRHKRFINILGHSKGSRTRSLESLLLLYRAALSTLLSGNRSDDEIMAAIKAEPKLKDLFLPDERTGPMRRKFEKNVVNAKVVQDTLDSRSRCQICKARLPPSSRSKNHKVAKVDGGRGELENLQFTHPFCNNSRASLPQIEWKQS